MKSEEWKTYRTRFLVTARQLISTLTFVDHLGRQHCGCKGDYLVESSDGVLSIAPRRIFEDVYVPISQLDETPLRQTTVGQTTPSEPKLDQLKFEPLDIEQIKLPKSRTVSQRVDAASAAGHRNPIASAANSHSPSASAPSGSRLGLM